MLKFSILIMEIREKLPLKKKKTNSIFPLVFPKYQNTDHELVNSIEHCNSYIPLRIYPSYI